MENNIIKFLKQKDYEKIQSIGQGGLGKTILMLDTEINELFVCKKYEPTEEIWKEQYYENFKTEIKLMYQLYHKNLVRIFSYYLYPKVTTGYIIMEYIQGVSITEYMNKFPEQIDSIFEQTIDAFSYLENNKILHRDIRQTNILINTEGNVKVIDLGFGKRIFNNNDFEKSISLNWPYQTPYDFNEQIYDFCTEIYFLGMLFKDIIEKNSISFKRNKLIQNMINPNRLERIQSFNEIKNLLITDVENILDLFDEEDKIIYREFSNCIVNRISSINGDISFATNFDEIKKQLTNIYRVHMLETQIIDVNQIINLFVSAGYSYWKKRTMPVYVLKNFIDLLNNCDNQRVNIIYANIQNRIRTIERMEIEDNNSDEIPF